MQSMIYTVEVVLMLTFPSFIKFIEAYMGPQTELQKDFVLVMLVQKQSSEEGYSIKRFS